MKILSLLVLMLSGFQSSGQETKQIKKEKDGDLEVYYVLKSDKNTKHGLYEKYFKYSNPMANGKLLTEKGQYEMNLKSGTWSTFWGEENILSKGNYDKNLKTGSWEYYKSGNVIEKGDFKEDLRDGLWVYFEKSKGIIERGFYKDGKKVGKWQYHYFNIPVQTYDYSLDSILQSFNEPAESEIIVSASQEIIKAKLDRSPQYVGHKRQFQSDMSTLTKYPLAARRIALEGDVTISFFVNEDGSTSDFEIIKDIGGDCAKSVIEALQKNSTKWKPGLYKSKKVKVKYYQTINFKLIIDPVSGLGGSEITYQ